MRDLDDKFCKGKVVEVDDGQKFVKVHYIRWNSRYDEESWSGRVMGTGHLVLRRYSQRKSLWLLKQCQTDTLGQVCGRLLGLPRGAMMGTGFDVAVEQTVGGLWVL